MVVLEPNQRRSLRRRRRRSRLGLLGNFPVPVRAGFLTSGSIPSFFASGLVYTLLPKQPLIANKRECSNAMF